MIKERFYNFTTVFLPAEEGGYTVVVPALPGCVTEGDTLEEARKMAQDAIQIYIESLMLDGERIPEGDREIVERIRIKAELA